MDSFGGYYGRGGRHRPGGEYQAVGIQAAGSRGQRWSTAVGGFNPVHTDVVVGEHGASHGGLCLWSVGEIHLAKQLGDDAVHDTVAAARQ